jgi:hypothetical protein
MQELAEEGVQFIYLLISKNKAEQWVAFMEFQSM